MDNIFILLVKVWVFVFVIVLGMYVVVFGYLMSLILLMFSYYNLDMIIVSWLVSSFYVGLLVGVFSIELLVICVGYKYGFVLCLGVLLLIIVVMFLFVYIVVWFVVWLVVGVVVVGVFVIVELWFLYGDEVDRVKCLGLYMGVL